MISEEIDKNFLYDYISFFPNSTGLKSMVQLGESPQDETSNIIRVFNCNNILNLNDYFDIDIDTLIIYGIPMNNDIKENAIKWIKLNSVFLHDLIIMFNDNISDPFKFANRVKSI